MSVPIVAKFAGDTVKFRQALSDQADKLAIFAEQSRAAGGIHHRFGVGDGYVVVIDEWQSVEHFQQFFSDPELQALIGEMGAEPGPPELIVSEAVSSPDQY